MYEAYVDSSLLYDARISENKVLSPKLTCELNKVGSFKFTIEKDHPCYDKLRKMKSIVTVYYSNGKTKKVRFRGRITDVETNFRNEKIVKCESELAFLLDTVVRPYEFDGSVADYFTMLVNQHNSQVGPEKRFAVGNVTVTDPNNRILRSSSEYPKTFDEVKKKLLDNNGGYLFFRHENGVTFIDYLKDIPFVSTQVIEFSKNLLDLNKTDSAKDIITAILPLGAKLKDEEGNETTERLTIAEVNAGKDYIQDDEKVAEYGFICATKSWDNVTLAENLLSKAKQELALHLNPERPLTVSAVDLAAINPGIDEFCEGLYINVRSFVHGINQLLLINKADIDILNPDKTKLTISGKINSFSDKTVETYRPSDGKDGKDAAIMSKTEPTDKTRLWLDTSVDPAVLKRWNAASESWEIINDTKPIEDAVENVEKHINAELIRTSEGILSTVQESYLSKSDGNKIVADLNTSLEQTSNSFDFKFSQFEKNLNELGENTSNEFSLIQRYIRFENGKILLGEVGNELELKIQNDRISFLQSGAEVAYFSNNKLYVVDGEFTNSLRLGQFAFMPRTNGSLSFKKVGL